MTEKSQNHDHFSLEYGNKPIAYQRRERNNNSPHILIKVHPDCRVVVHASTNISNEEVRVAVKKRSRWIYNQLERFQSQLNFINPSLYTSGETHYYLGKRYPLKVIESPHTKQQVRLLRGKLEVTLRPKNKDKVKQLLNDWYKARAKEVFGRRLDIILGQTLWVSKQPPIRVLTMRTQWGSCSPKGCLTLNLHLVKAPRECIDYVILHELCHIAEHNHSERFYRLMTQVMPDWQKTKNRLDGMAMMLLNGL
jgi:predicted metal-dependent hydrolase